MGEPQNLSQQKLQTLKKAAMLELAEISLIKTADHSLKLGLKMPTHSVCLLELIRAQ